MQNTEPPLNLPPHQLYNLLPSLQDADKLFSERSILSEIRDLFGPDNKNFALALVHRHTELSAGEIMVGRGDTTKPEIMDPNNVFASSWLDTGEPFEYSASPVPPLSKDLLKRFKDAMIRAGIRQFSGRSVLGICYIQDKLKEGELDIETTIGRSNVVTRVIARDLELDHMITAIWDGYAARACCVSQGGGHLDVCSALLHEL